MEKVESPGSLSFQASSSRLGCLPPCLPVPLLLPLLRSLDVGCQVPAKGGPSKSLVTFGSIEFAVSRTVSRSQLQPENSAVQF